MYTQPLTPRVSHQLFVWNPPLNLTQKNERKLNLKHTQIPPKNHNLSFKTIKSEKNPPKLVGGFNPFEKY